MEACVERGLTAEGVLPGGLHVPRRAAALAARLAYADERDGLIGLDWLTVYAMAVNEENAAGGRVVTPPPPGRRASSPPGGLPWCTASPSRRRRRCGASSGSC